MLPYVESESFLPLRQKTLIYLLRPHIIPFTLFGPCIYVYNAQIKEFPKVCKDHSNKLEIHKSIIEKGQYNDVDDTSNNKCKRRLDVDQ